MNGGFRNKWAVITGASHGIGAALARKMMDEGANVCLIARSEAELAAICAESRRKGVEAIYRAIDLRNREALEELCAELCNTLPAVDFLFCNAGKSICRKIIDARDRLHDYDRTMDLNYRSVVALSMALLPQLTKSRGSIVYSSSVSTLYPAVPGWSAYHASKTAANMWLETARAEFLVYGVKVKIAYLPLVHTPMSEVNRFYRNMPAMSADKAALVLMRLSKSLRLSYMPWWARLTAPISHMIH